MSTRIGQGLLRLSGGVLAGLPLVYGSFALAGEEGLKHCRTVEIMADAAHAILTRDARSCTGNFFIDDLVLADEGVTDFDQYRVDPTKPLMPDFFVPADTPLPPGVSMEPAA